MKNKKTFISFIILLFVFSTITIGCSNKSDNLQSQNQILKKENTELKDKVFQLQKEANKTKLAQDDSNTGTLNINYVEVSEKVRFIEKENYILALPQHGSAIMRPVYTNTLATVYEKALVDKETWLFIEIPTYDSPINNRGWIKESDTTSYTKDKVKLVQSDVGIEEGSEVYETEDFKDIKTTTPNKLAMKDTGRLQEKKDGFCKISQAGGKTIWVKESSVIYTEAK